MSGKEKDADGTEQDTEQDEQQQAEQDEQDKARQMDADTRTVTVTDADTLYSLAQAAHVTRSDLLARNLATLDDAARKAGYAAGSAGGRRLVPGTVLSV